MSFISKRRTALWVAGMERWARKELDAHTEQTAKGKNRVDRHGMYCAGVLSAVTMAKGGGSNRAAMPKDRDQRQGMTDATTLLRNVLTSGRVPGRDYAALLSDPGEIGRR
jgi:hypothetical protein